MSYRRRYYAALGVIACGLLVAAWGVRRLGGWRYTAHRLHTQSAWPTYTQRASLLALLPPVDSGDVVLLGDSHVAYGEWGELLSATRPVRNRGIPGEGVEGLAAFAKTIPLERASAVVVQVGTNDLLFHSPDWLLGRYRAFAGRLARRLVGGASTDLYVCTLPGVNNEVRWTGIDPADVAEVNAALRAFGGEPGVRVVDLAAALGTAGGVLPAGLTDDGVHLRGDGYLRWAEALTSATDAR